jgi:Polyketide cyclase / dehydrase and lipid transport
MPLVLTAALLVVAVAMAWFAVWAIPQFRTTRITSAFVIRCSQESVFTLMSDARNTPLFRHEYESVELMTPEPIGPGSRFHVRARIPPTGRMVDGVEEILDYQPNRRFTGWMASGSRPNFDEFTFEVVDGGTRVTHRFDFEYSFTMAARGALFSQRSKTRLILAMRRASERRLKLILESNGTDSVGPS